VRGGAVREVERKLGETLIYLLKDLYSPENQLVNALPKTAKAAASSDLRKAFEEHLKQTRHQGGKDRAHFLPIGATAARAWAQQLGYDSDADLLQKTLDEESMANEKVNICERAEAVPKIGLRST